MTQDLIIDEAIARLAPDFTALSLFVDADGSRADADGGGQLAEACRHVRDGGPSWADAHLTSWAEVYGRFGAKPNRTPCSAQALRKRVLKDELPRIGPVVDLYNAVSLRYAIPVGGENLEAYVGRPHLTLANGTEVFDTFANGVATVENPSPGEVVWRDLKGVTCRRWNWRQGTRTRLDGTSRRMWFVLERLETMPMDALEEAGDVLAAGLRRILPDCELRRTIVHASR